MIVELTNNVEKCPKDCDDFIFVLDEVNQCDRRKDGNIHVLVDCAHSEVCKYLSNKGDSDLGIQNTCKVVSFNDVFDEYERFIEYTFWNLSCGHGVITSEDSTTGQVPCFCTICGAKVVSE